MAELTGGGDHRDRLTRLTERLDLAAQRAERLLSESVLTAAIAPERSAPADAPSADTSSRDAGPERDAATPGRPPPSGWQPPHAGDSHERWLDADELELLLGVLAGVRDRIPPDLRRRLAAAVRELLMALRALIDWYLERTDRATTQSADVEDIPIL